MAYASGFIKMKTPSKEFMDGICTKYSEVINREYPKGLNGKGETPEWGELVEAILSTKFDTFWTGEEKFEISGCSGYDKGEVNLLDTFAEITTEGYIECEELRWDAYWRYVFISPDDGWCEQNGGIAYDGNVADSENVTDNEDVKELISIAESAIAIGYEWAPDVDDYGEETLSQLDSLNKKLNELKEKLT